MAMQQTIFRSINPATGEELECRPELTPAELERAIENCWNAQRTWREWEFGERSDRLRELALLLREREDRYARRMALEMGKVVTEGTAEIRKCARACDFYAEHGETWLRPDMVATEATRSSVAYVPLGVVLAVMPWNFPFWQVCRFGIPALLAGNGILMKHAPNVPGCAADLEQLFLEAGFPEGLMRSIPIDAARVADVIGDSRVAAVTLTGSVAAGRAVAMLAGRAVKKCVLELGGSDPFIVLEDADLDLAAAAAVASRFQNCGQSCIAAKRFILAESIREPFLERFLGRVSALRVGDPCRPESEIGPMARLDLHQKLQAQVESSLRAGGRVLLRVDSPEAAGAAYYPPMVIDGIPPASPAWHEELFGPVAVLMSARDEAEAVRLANDTCYGLAASVWTADAERGERVARSIESGMCFVNRAPFSDARMPFGGIKQSGYGRELAGFGMREFVNVRSLWVERA